MTDIAPAPQSTVALPTLVEAWKVAEALSRAQLVPDHFKGKPADCLLALQIADDLRCTPFQVMHNMYLVSGKPGFSSKFAIAMANQRGPFTGPIEWSIAGEGGSLSVTAFADLASTGNRVAMTADMAMARAEKWTKNAKYQSMPEIMLRYRSAAFLIRMYCPEVLMGALTFEEHQDLRYAEARPVDEERAAEAASVVDALNEDIKELPAAVADDKEDPDARHSARIMEDGDE